MVDHGNSEQLDRSIMFNTFKCFALWQELKKVAQECAETRIAM